MTFTAYADRTAFTVWLGAEAPANTDQLLRSATFLVAAACNRNPYIDVPSDVDALVLSDATCAQAALWLANGVNPDAAGLDVKVASEKKIGTADIKYDSLDAAELSELVTCLAPQPMSILYTGGLLWLPVPLGDEAPFLLRYGLDDGCRLPWVESL